MNKIIKKHIDPYSITLVAGLGLGVVQVYNRSYCKAEEQAKKKLIRLYFR